MRDQQGVGTGPAPGGEGAASEPDAPPGEERAPQAWRIERDDLALSVLLLLLVADVAIWPFAEGVSPWVADGVRTLVIVAGAWAIVPTRALAVAAVLVVFAALVLESRLGQGAPPVLALRLAGLALVEVGLLRQVFRPGRINAHRILGAIAVYVILAGLWAVAYQLLTALRPGAIRGAAGPATPEEVVWLSFVTITTTGYGDVLPVTAAARALAALEAMVGVLYPAILISRLVSLAVSRPPSDG